jgi:hypothetical protein
VKILLDKILPAQLLLYCRKILGKTIAANTLKVAVSSIQSLTQDKKLVG